MAVRLASQQPLPFLRQRSLGEESGLRPPLAAAHTVLGERLEMIYPASAGLQSGGLVDGRPGMPRTTWKRWVVLGNTHVLVVHSKPVHCTKTLDTLLLVLVALESRQRGSMPRQNTVQRWSRDSPKHVPCSHVRDQRRNVQRNQHAEKDEKSRGQINCRRLHLNTDLCQPLSAMLPQHYKAPRSRVTRSLLIKRAIYLKSPQ